MLPFVRRDIARDLVWQQARIRLGAVRRGFFGLIAGMGLRRGFLSWPWPRPGHQTARGRCLSDDSGALDKFVAHGPQYATALVFGNLDSVQLCSAGRIGKRSIQQGQELTMRCGLGVVYQIKNRFRNLTSCAFSGS